MKTKLKIFFLALLGLVLYPTTTNAFEVLKINDDFPEITTVSSVVYQGETYYYKIQEDGRQLNCISAGTVINEENKSQFLSLPSAPDKTCPNGTLKVLHKNWYGKTFGVSDYGLSYEGSYGYNNPEVQDSYDQWYFESGIKKRYFKIERLFNDKGQSAIHFLEIPAIGEINLKSNLGESKYNKGYQGAYGLLVFKNYDNDFDYSILVRGKFWLHGYAFISPMNVSEDYSSDKLFLLDTKNHIQYEFNELLLDKLKERLWLLDFWLEDNCPTRIRNYSIVNDNEMSFVDWRNITEKECQTYKKDIKSRRIYIPEYLQFMSDNIGVPESTGSNLTTGTSNQALMEYNACFKYYNSIKKYTSYNYNCYKTLIDTAPLTGSYDSKKILKPWQEIEDWDGESDFAVSTENVVCNSFARVKRDYKQQYKEKWEDFLKVSSENFFYPHAMDIKGYCGERPKLEDNSSWWDKTKDFFLGRTGEPRMVDDNGKKYYENDFDPEWRKLRSLYARCQGLDKRGIMKSFTMKEEERLQYCSEYKTEKEKFMKKWEHATIGKFFGGSLQASILAIEGSGKGDGVGSGFFHKLKNDISNSIIGDSFSYVGEEVFARIKSPFYSGYNSVLGVNCANSGVPHIEIMDYIAMGIFALLAFLIFKIL